MVKSCSVLRARRWLQGEAISRFTTALTSSPSHRTRTPFEIKTELASRLPSIYNELLNVTNDLEKHMSNMLDVEFTIQGKEGNLNPIIPLTCTARLTTLIRKAESFTSFSADRGREQDRLQYALHSTW